MIPDPLQLLDDQVDLTDDQWDQVESRYYSEDETRRRHGWPRWVVVHPEVERLRDQIAAIRRRLSLRL